MIYFIGIILLILNPIVITYGFEHPETFRYALMFSNMIIGICLGLLYTRPKGLK